MRNTVILHMFMFLFCIAFISLAIDGRTIPPSVTYGKTPECDYLEYDETQQNSYSHSSLDDGYCCLCPRGKKWVGDCLSNNPSSTQCQACEPDHYLDFEPHMQPDCYPKRERFCFSPKEYYKGTITERDGCVCPDGMYEDELTKQCMSINTTPAKFTEASTAETTTEEITNTPMEPPDVITEKSKVDVPTIALATTDSSIHLASTEAKSTTGAEYIVSTAINRKITPTTELDDIVTKIQSSDLTLVGKVALAALGSIVAFVIIGVLIWKITERYWRMKCTNDWISSSSTTKLNKDHTGSQDMSGTENAALAKNIQQPPVPSRRDEQIIINEENECLLKAQPIGCEYQDPNYTNPNIRLNVIMNSTDDILPRHWFLEFATEVGVKLGEECAKCDILPLFRRIVGHEYRHRLDDISVKYTDRMELFYQCMQFAINHKGTSLSPRFILNEVRKYGMTRYTEIVEGVLERFLRSPVEGPVSEITQQCTYSNERIQQPSSD